MKNLYPSTFLLIGLALFFISCSKESIVEPSDPIESLKEWFLLNSTIQGQENIIWNKAKPIKLKDSSIAFAFPVISKVGIKELIIFERNGFYFLFYLLWWWSNLLCIKQRPRK